MITIFLPWPDRALSPNARVDRRAKVGIVREHREAAAMVTRALHTPFGAKRIDLYITFRPPDNRHRDLDNCYSMCKAYQDGIMDALGLDDRCIVTVSLRFGKPKTRGDVRFELYDEDKEGIWR